MTDRKDLRAPVKRYSRPRLEVKAPAAIAKRKTRLEDVAAMMFGHTDAEDALAARDATSKNAGQPGRQSKTEQRVVKGPAVRRRPRNLDLP